MNLNMKLQRGTVRNLFGLLPPAAHFAERVRERRRHLIPRVLLRLHRPRIWSNQEVTSRMIRTGHRGISLTIKHTHP